MKPKISITDLSYFSDCRRQWWLSKTYSPKKPQSHFWLGSLVHKGLETYYKGKKDLPIVLRSMQEYITKSFSSMSETFTPWETFRPELEELGELALGMVQNYSVYDYENPLQGKVVEVEKYVTIPQPTFNLSGRIDLVLKRSDGLWVVDHKTASSTYDLKGLDVDEQLTGYAYMVWKLYGEIPAGVLYNVLIKDLPAEPRILKNGELSKDKDQRTIYTLYLQKIQELGLEEEKYSDFLSMLKSQGWGKFFTRDGSTRNEHELLNFETRARRKGEDILKILKDPTTHAYPSPSTFRCSSCVFLGVCKAMEDGGDYQYILNNHFLPNSYY